MTLAINCDVILAAEDIDLGYPEIDVGIIRIGIFRQRARIAGS